MAWLTPPIWQPIALSDSTDGDHNSSPHCEQQFGLCGSDSSCESPPTTGSASTPPLDPASSPASLDAGRLRSVALRVSSLTSELRTATAWPLSRRERRLRVRGGALGARWLWAPWLYPPVGSGRPLALGARWLCPPVGSGRPLAMGARWLCPPVGSVRPLALSARWLCPPAGSVRPLALGARWLCPPVGSGRPLALSARWLCPPVGSGRGSAGGGDGRGSAGGGDGARREPQRRRPPAAKHIDNGRR